MPEAHNEVIQRLRLFAERSAYVVAVWVEGSVASGLADEFSDVDVFVAVTGETATNTEVVSELTVYLGDFLVCRSFYAGGSAYSIILTSGIGVDLFIRPATKPLTTTLEPLVVYDPEALLSSPARENRVGQALAQKQLADFWYFAYYYQKKALCRKQLFYASYGLEIMRQSLVDLFRLLNRSQWIGFKYKHIDDELSAEQLRELHMTLAHPTLESITEAMGYVVSVAARITPDIARMYELEAPVALMERVIAFFENSGTQQLYPTGGDHRC